MIDEIDKRIISALQKDGRHSYVKLARELGVSIATISRRVKRLEAVNIIKIQAVPEPTKLGDSVYAIIAINVKMDKIEEVCSQLSENSCVYFVGQVLGRFDIFTSVYLPSVEALNEFTKNELASIDGIENTETFYVAKLVKRVAHGWLLK